LDTPQSRVRPTSSSESSAAAEPPPRGSLGTRSLRVKELLVEGVVYEFIAIPCGYRYTMPLGLRWGDPPRAKVYRGTGLYSILKSGNVERIILYAPTNPLDFALSVTHELDKEVGLECEPPRPYIVMYNCQPRATVDKGDYIELECPGEIIEGTPIPYSRLYGAIIEILVAASKVGAGVLGGEFASNCMQCSEWAARGAGGRAFMDMQEVLQAAAKALLGSRGLPKNV
jgi:hypothetical protein